MIIVTGGAGFIGSNIVHGLNSRGIDDILIVDDLTDGNKCVNLSDATFKDYIDKEDFAKLIKAGYSFGNVSAFFHQGACSDTTEHNGKLMMKVNYDYSKEIYHWTSSNNIPFYYASSASVYGNGQKFVEERRYERPLNVYAFSKHLFDSYVRAQSCTSPVVGLRYFNVYGPREQHKGHMASMALHIHNQLKNGVTVSLFEGSGGYMAGCQERDFIHVNDVVALNLWLLENPQISGIFNCGTGIGRSFNDMANNIISYYKKGTIEYIPFPNSLIGRYQSFTQADISSLRSVGYKKDFISLENGIESYMHWLDCQ